MADNEKRTPSPSNDKSLAGGIERFKALPQRTKMLIFGAFGFFVLMFFIRGGNNTPPVQQTEQPQAQVVRTDVRAIGADAANTDDEKLFEGLDANRPALMQRWLQQQQQALTTLQDDIEGKFGQLEEKNNEDRRSLEDLGLKIEGMLQTFQAEMRTLEESNSRDREVLNRLHEQTRELKLQAPVQSGGEAASPRRRTRITQTPLAGGAGSPNPNAALFGNFVRSAGRGPSDTSTREETPEEKGPPPPFIPPLGFIKGTLLNGVDALVGGGQATPALVRLQGSYKTAMNSTVSLEGCFVMVEFEGDISTERAFGKPSRMTCVYPDQGAVTYALSGYVVDHEDGIVGVPGVFYEGNASRLAAAMLADFASGVAEVIESNQTTSVVTPEGNQVNTITGGQLKSEIAGGAGNAVSSLRDYLFERASRNLPFVRIDTTRQINLVFLSGTELRTEGSAWTLLFDASAR